MKGRQLYDTAGERRCLECGEPLAEYGRRDRKFCCPHCKDDWHNRNRRDLRSLRMKLETALSRNYVILDAMLDAGMTSARIEDLVQVGFKTDYVSSFRKSGRKDVVWCYDIKYVLTGTRITQIERLSSVL